MQLIRRSNGETIELHGSSSLGAGGEARVFVIGSDSKQVAKVYRQTVESRAGILRNLLPSLLILFTALFLASFFAVAMFLPMIKLLEGLSK